MKKLALVLVLVLAFALPVFANPFVDVPLNHWAYDSVQSLAAKGIIAGFPDGTFGGGKSLTRYEFAEATAKALAYVEGMDFASADDVAILEKLAIEFADELASLGVTVADLEAALGENTEAIAAFEARIAKLEDFFEPVKITGSFEAKYSYEIPLDTPDAIFKGSATLSDTTTFNIAATINDKTTAGVKATIVDAITGTPTATWSDFFIDYQGDKAQLRVGDVLPSTIALGLIYKAPDDPFNGGLITWNYLDGAWTGFAKVDDYYTVNTDFDLFGVTASLDKATMTYVGGLDLSYDINEDTSAAVEAAVQTDPDFTTSGYAGAATLGTKVGDVDLAVDGHYVTAGFEPTAGGFTADRMGGGGEVLYPFSDDISVKVAYAYDQKVDTPEVVTNEISGELKLTYTDVTTTLTGGYNFITEAVPAGLTLVYDKATAKLSTDDVLADPIVYVAYAEYAGYKLTEEVALSLNYQFESDTNENTAVATLVYDYSDVLTATLEGRYDSVPATDVPVYSIEITLDHALAENTTLTVGYEHNDWDGDEDVRDILDAVGTLSAELYVTF